MFRKIAGGTEPEPIAHFTDLKIGILQQCLCLFQPLAADVILQADAHLLAEFMAEIVFGVFERRSQLLEKKSWAISKQSFQRRIARNKKMRFPLAEGGPHFIKVYLMYNV